MRQHLDARYHSDTTAETFTYGNDLAATGRPGRTRTSVRGRIGHFTQWPVGRSTARVSGREEARIAHGTAVANASAGASSGAASHGRASAAASVRLKQFDSDSYMRQRNTFHSGF